jgi:hypothetical protein
MHASLRAARIGAASYILWGLVHVAGAAFQLSTLRAAGGVGLTSMVSTGAPFGPGAVAVFPEAAAAYMQMGALNLVWIGLLVGFVGVTRNWRNDRVGYWLNLALVGGTDLSLLVALLLPGYMAWGDGAIGLTLFVLALIFSTLGRRQAASTA